MTSKIETHRQLAEHIAGRRILHLNSLGKDSVVALEWLTSYARPSHVVSVYFEFQAEHPGDRRYLEYLKRRYPHVEFVKEPNSVELTLQILGVYQTPQFVTHVANHSEYVEFERGKQISELKEKYQCEYSCDGSSKYESFARRTKFHQKGLLFKGTICPLGMMSKAQVISLIRDTGVKLHPCYKLASGTYDHPSYWKMRASWISNEAYRKKLLEVYPLLILDQYRYERLL